MIDILGKLDFDYVFIDGEHGPFDLERLEELCRAAERYNLTTFARVPDIGSSTILRYLDRGIMGILGPHIATEADAKQLVRACYFGPMGERSFGGNRGTDYNAGIPDKVAYYREANEQMLVCALLEDRAVLDNLDAILAVPGIDLFSIGLNDFAQSMGHPRPDQLEAASGEGRDHRRHPRRKMQADVMKAAGVSDMLLEGVPAGVGDGVNPGYSGLYTVQYWNAAWEPLIFSLISKIASEGYDGIFLDVLDGSNEWSAGNTEGNPVYSGATQAMVGLLSDITTYVDGLHLSRPFYLVGNNPDRIAAASPASLQDLDGIFNETLYYLHSPTDVAVS